MRFGQLRRAAEMVHFKVVKDLDGYAFGSNAFNAGKVLIQDHIFFAAAASWLLSAHISLQQAQRWSQQVPPAASAVILLRQ